MDVIKERIKVREVHVTKEKRDLDNKQKKFRDDYNETLVNF